MKHSIVCLAVSTLLLGGCVSTGVRVGPVYIPVETGIGKNKPKKEEAPEERLPPRSSDREDLEVSGQDKDESDKDESEKDESDKNDGT